MGQHVGQHQGMIPSYHTSLHFPHIHLPHFSQYSFSFSVFIFAAIPTKFTEEDFPRLQQVSKLTEKGSGDTKKLAGNNIEIANKISHICD